MAKTKCYKLLIGDAVKRLDVTHETVRLWVEKGLLPSQRTPGGYRLFDSDDIERLARERASRRTK